ncbi:hypothetical protein H0H93_003868 [Arthromyces matolae]|nr:hypothetical protein H0H93_003868 [Arthromyces matolae]
MSPQITLYTAKTEIALAESGLEFTRFEIDLQNKPEWYAPRVNPASKVPAIAYGGPAVAPDDPSPESTKLAESLVLLEFIADLAKPGTLLPTDPVLRAKVRFFIDTVSNTIGSTFGAVFFRGEPIEKLLESFEKIQSLLPAEGYAIGSQFTIADAAVAPFFARVEVILAEDAGSFDAGVGPKTLEVLNQDPKFERYRRYFADIKARESFQKTFDRVACTGLNEGQDIDIIVITEMDPEDLKDLIAESDQRFYLVPSVNPRNTYQVLWFSVSPRKSCKVDILVPGLLSIPVIPVSKIVYINQDIPVVPFLLLLLLKLRGWTDHRVDSRPRMRDKVEVDEGDIEELLELGVEEYKAHLDQESWLPEWFVQEMEERVVEYVERWPDSKQAWRSLGL